MAGSALHVNGTSTRDSREAIETQLPKADVALGCAAPSPEALKNLWRDRLQECQRRYLIAKAICTATSRECASGHTTSAGSQFAYERALQLETAALEEYKHALEVFTDLKE